MDKVVIQCPKCKTRFKVANAQKLDGFKVLCKKCNTPFRVQLPKKVRAQAEEEIIEVGEDLIVDSEPDPDSEFDFSGVDAADEGQEVGDDFAPGSLMSAKKKSKKKKKASKEKAEDEDNDEDADEKTGKKKGGKKGAGKGKNAKQPIGLIIAVVAVGLLLLVGLGVGGFFLIRLASAGGGKFTPPTNYVHFKPKDFVLACDMPEGWKEDHGGGQGGQPAWARFTDGHVVIEARESISGGAIGAAGMATSQKSGAGDDERLSPVARLHAAQKKQFSENYWDYHETDGVRIDTGFGEGRISDFNAKEGLFKTAVRGCRATTLTTIRQFTISCKCPPSMFDAARPMFEKVIKSIGGGSRA